MFEELLERTGGSSQFITNEWVPEILQAKLGQFQRDDPGGFARLNALAGNPPEEERLREAVDTPPRWLREAASLDRARRSAHLQRRDHAAIGVGEVVG
jgi:hypothetical protein